MKDEKSVDIDIHAGTSRNSKEIDGTTKAQYAIILGIIIFSTLFVLNPFIDIKASELFWTPTAGFALTDNDFLVSVRDFHREGSSIIIKLAALVLILFGLGMRLHGLIMPHIAVFVITSYALGAGLLVHALKIGIGRARPNDILDFGGSHAFTPAWQISDACSAHCSFISGESATAVAMLSLAALVKGRWRRIVFAALIPPAIFFSLNRMALGAHFLSDIVMAWLLTGLATVTLWQVINRHSQAIDKAMDGWLVAAGDRASGYARRQRPWLDAALRTLPGRT